MKTNNLIRIFILILFSLSLSVQAELYTALHGGNTKVLGGDKGVKNGLTGHTYGATLGYSFPLFLSVEGAYRHLDSKGTVTFNGGNTPTDVSMNVKVLTAGARLRFWMFFNVLGGIASYDYKSTATQNGQDISTWPLNGNKSGSYFGGGIKIPLPKIDIFSDLIFMTNSPTGHQNIELGIRYFF